MPQTIQDLTESRQRAMHRLHLLESEEMSVRCLRTALLDNSTAIAAARNQIARLDAALAQRAR